jgi:class 3 adenylate cyclase/tetratricopeptide (TPR) repeat protein
LRKVLVSTKKDTTRVNLLIELSSNFYRNSPEEALNYSNQARDLAEKIDFKVGLGYAYKSIGMAYYFQSKPLEAVLAWEKSLVTFQEINYIKGISNMLNNLGAVYFNEGNDAKALNYYLESLKVAEEINDTLRIATAYVNIGAVYSRKDASVDLALKYYQQSITLSELLGDYDAIGTSAANLGELYLRQNADTSALYYFDMALQAYKKSTNGNVPYALNGIGKVYSQRGDYAQAIRYFSDAFYLAKDNNAEIEMAQALIELSRVYTAKGEFTLALKNYKRAEEIARSLSMRGELTDTYEGLAKTYAKLKDFKNAFQYQELFSNLKDTIYNAEMDKKMQAQSLLYDIEKQQGEIELLAKDKALQELDIKRQKTIRNATAITGVLILFLAMGLFNRYKYVRKTSKIIATEKERSEKLLLNILPEETAEELKSKGSATPKHYDKVTVLFTDFKGFTKIAEKLTPQELVEELNQCFLEFDRIIDKHNLEKIKTIGDAYMCAGGIPVANDTNPMDVVAAGLEIKKYMENLKKDRESRGEDYWELRIGIHTGPVIAGVVGKNKFAYDIWGDAVNTASRMESSGIPGKVNISGATFELVKNRFKCTYRGKVAAKNKGEIDMYIVEGVKLNDVKQHMEEIESKS